ncbi:MAG: hypothetical protein LBS44_03970 [Deltaproteobacteria bacterium]|jgi:hypothetical protein|nr:hypothetical protein [Deltaproteobacteria bacterium]
MIDLFTDREFGSKIQNVETISDEVFNAMFNAILSIYFLFNISMLRSFPIYCDDRHLIGFNEPFFIQHLKGLIPSFPVYGTQETIPIISYDVWKNCNQYILLDFIELCFKYIEDYEQGQFHTVNFTDIPDQVIII